MKPKNVLFLVPYPKEGASARLRVYQFLPYLRKEGIAYNVRPFLTSGFYSILYKKGYYCRKLFLFVWCKLRRLFDVITAFSYDVIFIHREAFPLGPPVLEAFLFLCGKKVIFDYDDAIYLPPEGSSPIMALFKCPGKTDFLIRHSSAVIAGNELLRDHAACLNKNVIIIPTCIDTDLYEPVHSKKSGADVVIGWIGSHTTQVFLKETEEVFRSLLSRYANLKIHLVGGRIESLAHERLIVKEWSLDTERDDIMAFDIGIMPMPDTDWTRGKCAFKAILYMSLGMPVVASGVGVNVEIIKDGQNGFLAATKGQWEEKLSRLIEDASLRSSLGKAGRDTVVKGYSLRANAPLFAETLKNVSKEV